jgi:hypothetical protein
MIAKDFAQYLERFADLLDSAGAIEQARAWRAAVPIFQARPSAKVKDVCSAISKLGTPIASGPVTAQALIQLWPSMERHLEKHTKSPLVDDLKAFITSLSPFARCSLEDLSSALSARPSTAPARRGGAAKSANPDVVPTYLLRLEAALGDEAKFLEVYNALKSDSAIKAPDAKRLARDFTKRSAKSKPDALNRIWERHASLIGAGGRAKATGGRTAA